LYLEQPVPDIDPIPIPTGQLLEQDTRPGVTATVAGWGATTKAGKRFPAVLRFGQVELFPDESCGNGADYTVEGVTFNGFTKREADPESMLCAIGVSMSVDMTTGLVSTCTALPDPGSNSAECVLEGVPQTSTLRVEAIAGNSAGNSPLSTPLFIEP
jgi:hypothetical protein